MAAWRGAGKPWRGVAVAAGVVLAAIVTACEPAPPANPPFGVVDGIREGDAFLTVHGWVIDPDTPDPVGVHVYVNGRFAGAALASAPRPDVAAAYPGSGEAHGYAVTVGPVEPGWNDVCAYGINNGPGDNALLGCRRWNAAHTFPIGAFDALTVLGIDADAVTVEAVGWALSHHTPAPIEVAILVDGQRRTTVTASLPRPDVGAAFPVYGPDHGFRSGPVVVSTGTFHRICAEAVGSWTIRSLGCWQVWDATVRRLSTA